MHELALGASLAAHILVHEDEAFMNEFLRRSQIDAVVVDPVRRHGVGRPIDQDRERLRRKLWRIHRGEQTHAVPHRYQELMLGVIRLDVLTQVFCLLLFLVELSG